MNQLTKKIVWEKWTDPWGRDNLGGATPVEEPEELEEDIAYLDDEPLVGQMGTTQMPYFMAGMITKMGPIPIYSDISPSKNWNFWTGHTNFKLTQSLLDTIAETDGVESLDVYTRYRFRVSIGKAWGKNSGILSLITQNVVKRLERDNKSLIVKKALECL